MHYRLLLTLALTILLALFNACGGGAGGETGDGSGSSSACTPDIPVSAGLFTSPPTNIANIADVIPLGNMNPGGGHVIPVNHMYLSYPFPAGGGALSYLVHAMASGRIFMLMRDTVSSSTDYDYSIYINHTCSVTSYFIHLHGLSRRIQDYIAAHAIPWQDISGSGTGPWIMFLGQAGGAPMLNVSAGEELGITKNYSHSWDAGVIDKRYLSGAFINTSANRYPHFSDFMPLFLSVTVDMSVYPFLGNQYLNAGCFIDYMSSAGGLKAAWFAKLSSTPQDCGRVGWDSPGYLQGVWFNPAIDTIGLKMDHEVAALAIVPDNLNPTTKVQIGWGNASNGSTLPSLALLDPSAWTPPISGVTQISNPFKTYMDNASVAIVNPNPANVKAGVTVCYDLQYNSSGGTRYNYIMFHMTDSTTLKVKYEPTEQLALQCRTLLPLPLSDASWKTYIR